MILEHPDQHAGGERRGQDIDHVVAQEHGADDLLHMGP
jgi:hypothetical protein